MYGYERPLERSVHVIAAPRSGAALLVDLLRQGTVPGGASGSEVVTASDDAALDLVGLAAGGSSRFVYLYRDPRETISSMIDAWRSGQHVSRPELSGWTGPPWSLPLVPGWEDLRGASIPEIAARQWAAITTAALDGLDSIESTRWCVTSYDRLLDAPDVEVGRIARFCDLDWRRPDRAYGPAADRSSPEPQQWRHNAADIDAVWPQVEAVAQRALGLFADRPRTRPLRPPTTHDGVVPDATEPDDRDGGFRSVHTTNMPALLAQLGITVFVSTYQSGRVIAVRSDGSELNTHFRMFRSPMGIAVDPARLAIGTQMSVFEYRNQPAVARKLQPEGRHDAAYLPRVERITGELQIHEVARAGGELWIAATRFSCLATLDDDHSFVPRWRPPFVSAIAAEDRCHLNGLAVVDDEVRYVTAMGETDIAGGWRDRKADGGVVIDVRSGEVVTRGLSMPHSPRVHDGKLWVLSSGRGEVCTVDLATGAREVVTKLPGFTRGLAFAGPFAFVGLSQVRESIFGGIPIADELTESERSCGVWVLDTRTGETVGFLRFEGTVQELFDVQVLHGVRWPELAEPDSNLAASSFVVPDGAMSDVHVARP